MEFRFRPNPKYSKITAAEDEEKAKSLSDIVDEKSDVLSDDFDYFIAGIEKLWREDKCQEAIAILDKVSEAIAVGISEVGDYFTEEPIDEE